MSLTSLTDVSSVREPFCELNGITLYHGDALSILPTLPAESFQTCVTSPPYYRLRSYGVPPSTWGDGWVGCLGLEPTVQQYAAHICELFREVRRVLRSDGTLWLVIGDAYSKHATDDGLKPTDLLGVPWATAFALRADGWYLRSDIVWAKTSALPECVLNRPIRFHEFVFLFAKNRRYYYDSDAVREPYSPTSMYRFNSIMNGAAPTSNQPNGDIGRRERDRGYHQANPLGRLQRSVWTLPCGQHPEHSATFPEQLARLCILAGSRPSDTVLDPFVGVGTTCLAAIYTDRNAVGIDMNREYLRAAIGYLQGNR